MAITSRSSLGPPIRKRATSTRPTLEEVPALRVARLRDLVRDQVPDANGAYRIIIDTREGPQSITLVPDPRPYGARLLAACDCGRRAAVLRRDWMTGRWRCAGCLRLRCARSRFRDSKTFRAYVLPALLLERARRKLAYRTAPRAKRELFAAFEKETLEHVAQVVGSVLPPSDDAEAEARGVRGAPRRTGE
jgi:hypothetical protein